MRGGGGGGKGGGRGGGGGGGGEGGGGGGEGGRGGGGGGGGVEAEIIAVCSVVTPCFAHRIGIERRSGYQRAGRCVCLRT